MGVGERRSDEKASEVEGRPCNKKTRLNPSTNTLTWSFFFLFLLSLLQECAVYSLFCGRARPNEQTLKQTIVIPFVITNVSTLPVSLKF